MLNMQTNMPPRGNTPTEIKSKDHRGVFLLSTIKMERKRINGSGDRMPQDKCPE